jgi:hypothetical protein
MGANLNLRQRVSLFFVAGFVGGLSVVLFSHLLYNIGVLSWLGIKAPVSLSPPELYRPLVWGGLWGLPFGLVAKLIWDRLYVFGLLYFIAPVIALMLVFAPMRGMGLFGIDAGATMPFYLTLVNVPYGIVTALAARLLVGSRP